MGSFKVCRHCGSAFPTKARAEHMATHGLPAWHRRPEPVVRPTREERFWARVYKTATCWLWQGARDANGYGRVTTTYAHRFAYMTSTGPIPPGLQLDHLCRTPPCVNPAHLEAVTPLVNVRRGIASRAAERIAA